MCDLTGRQAQGAPVADARVRPVAYRGGVGEAQTPPPEISKALQSRAKLNPIVKTVKNF